MEHDPEYYMLPADKQDLIHKSIVDRWIEDKLSHQHLYRITNWTRLVLKEISDLVYNIGSCCTVCEECPHCNEYSDPDTFETYHGCTHINHGTVVKVHPNHICNECEYRKGYRYRENDLMYLLTHPEDADLVPRNAILAVIEKYIADNAVPEYVISLLTWLCTTINSMTEYDTYCKDCKRHADYEDYGTGIKCHGCTRSVKGTTVPTNPHHLCGYGISEKGDD